MPSRSHLLVRFYITYRENGAKIEKAEMARERWRKIASYPREREKTTFERDIFGTRENSALRSHFW